MAVSDITRRMARRQTRSADQRSRNARGPERGVMTMRASYIRVLVVWVIVLVGLYLLQEYFT